MRSRHLALAASLAGISTAAIAHITLAEPSAPAGSYHAAFFRVSHGCAGSPTLAIRVEIPANVTVARPQPKAGWTVAIERAPLPSPVRSEGGEMVNDRVAAITWTGQLAPDEFDQFGVMLKLPDATGPLYFPTIQRCVSSSTSWTTIPAAGQAWHSVKTPAPVLELMKPSAGAMSM